MAAGLSLRHFGDQRFQILQAYGKANASALRAMQQQKNIPLGIAILVEDDVLRFESEVDGRARD